MQRRDSINEGAWAYREYQGERHSGQAFCPLLPHHWKRQLLWNREFLHTVHCISGSFLSVVERME